MVKGRKRPIEVLTPEEVERLIQANSNPGPERDPEPGPDRTHVLQRAEDLGGPGPAAA